MLVLKCGSRWLAGARVVVQIIGASHHIGAARIPSSHFLSVISKDKYTCREVQRRSHLSSLNLVTSVCYIIYPVFVNASLEKMSVFSTSSSSFVASHLRSASVRRTSSGAALHNAESKHQYGLPLLDERPKWRKVNGMPKRKLAKLGSLCLALGLLLWLIKSRPTTKPGEQAYVFGSTRRKEPFSLAMIQVQYVCHAGAATYQRYKRR